MLLDHILEEEGLWSTVAVVGGGLAISALAVQSFVQKRAVSRRIEALPRLPVPGEGLVFDEEDFLPGFASRHGGVKIHTYRSLPRGDASPRGVMVIFHGWNEHCGRHAHIAEEFALRRGMVVVGMDMRGHGKSHGKRGYIYPDYHSFADDAEDFCAEVSQLYKGLPIFLYGLSMGGKTCLHLALRDAKRPKKERRYAGLVLGVPAIVAKEDLNPWLQKVSSYIARVTPWLPVLRLERGLGTANYNNLVSFEQDPLCYTGWVSASTGNALLRSCDYLSERLSEVDTPFIVVQGAFDRLVEPKGVKMLFSRSTKVADGDKVMKFYECEHDVVHEHLAEDVINDFGEWVDMRLKQFHE